MFKKCEFCLKILNFFNFNAKVFYHKKFGKKRLLSCKM